MTDLHGIAGDIASEISPDSRLDTLVRPSGMVTIDFGDGIWIILIRDQALMVVQRILELILHHLPMQVVRSNTYQDHDILATCNMTFKKGLADPDITPQLAGRSWLFHKGIQSGQCWSFVITRNAPIKKELTLEHHEALRLRE